MSFAFQSECTNLGPQYITSGPNTCHDECIFGCDALNGTSRYPGASSDASTYMFGLYKLMPTKSTGVAIVFSSAAVNFGASLPAALRYASVYFPSSITV